MDCNILVWNVRGLNNPARRGVVRSVIRSHNVAMACIQESKLEFVDLGIVQQCCGQEFNEFTFAPAVGTRGGIILAWKGDKFNLPHININANFIAAHGRTSSGSPFGMLTVYGPQDFSDKLQFLANMKTAYQQFPQDTPVFLGGDFNLIAQASDKSNNNISRRGITAFRGFINDLQLKDLYLQGRRYTWSNDQARATMVKLDRVLFNDSWDAAFPGSLLQALSSEISDHCTLLLTCDAPFRPTRHFRFENYWVKMENFDQVVQHAWH